MEHRGKVLICVGPSPRARAVGREGLLISQQLKYQPVFLQAGPDPQAAMGDLRRLLAEIAPEIEPTDQTLLARSGTAGPVIVEAAEEIGADLVAMGALDRDPMFTRLWGSVARHVARSAHCSVLLIPQPRLERGAYKHVVAGVSLDTVSLRMVEMALALMSRGDGATLDVVHEFSISEAIWAVRTQAGRASWGETVDEYTRSREQAERQILDEFLSGIDPSGVQVRKLAVPGRDGVEAIERAREGSVDMLVMPAPMHRLRLLDRVFHHPAEMALQRLPCRLLLYREHSLH